MTRWLIIEHEPDAPAGLLAEWATRRGVELDVCDVRSLPPLSGHDGVVSLGSEAHAYEQPPWLDGELALLREAIDRDLPVLGICFGAQALALALGGEVRPARTPELGWHAIDSDEPDAIPPGPWLQWHSDEVVVPASDVVARNSACVQAFRRSRSLGVQFHPEVDRTIVEGWLDADRDAPARAGTTAADLLEATDRHVPAARQQAWRLFDGFLTR